ncbi:type III secretion protein, partial [Pseudomonas gingeri]|nr:type III secretion protein [Pseudomonas gingeri]
LAGAADLLRDPAELVAAIERDGQTCVAAWLHLQPESLKGWLSLRLDSPRFDQARLSRDIEIVRGAAALLSAEEAPDKESRDE